MQNDAKQVCCGSMYTQPLRPRAAYVSLLQNLRTHKHCHPLVSVFCYHGLVRSETTCSRAKLRAGYLMLTCNHYTPIYGRGTKFFKAVSEWKRALQAEEERRPARVYELQVLMQDWLGTVL